MGTPEYTDRSHGFCSIETEAREQFLDSVSRLAPTVLEQLRGLLSLYGSLHAASGGRIQDLIKNRRFGFLKEAGEIESELSTNPDTTDLLQQLKAGLQKWAADWYINAPWVLDYAELTLSEWQIGELADTRFAQASVTSFQNIHYPEEVSDLLLSDRWKFLSESWMDFKARVELSLSSYEERIRKMALDNGYMQVPKIPSDLPIKLECAALYLCGWKQPGEIGAMPQYAREKSRVFRWIKEATKLLQLPTRPTGRQRKNVART